MRPASYEADMNTPREHGFWVMLGIALSTGSALGRSTATVLLAVLLSFVTVFGAMVVGRTIRKNSLLQALAALFLGGLILPLGVIGQCPFGRSALYTGALTFVFLSTTLSVQAVLLRARRRPKSARLNNLIAIGIATAGLAWAALSSRLLLGVSFAPVLFLGLWLALRAPSPKKLRWIGLSIALLQLLSGASLVVDDLMRA